MELNLYSTDYAFAAVLKDGTMVNWGDKYCGGDSSSILLALIGVETVMRAPTYDDGSDVESLYQSLICGDASTL